MKNVFTNEGAIVNFIFFLSNHNGITKALDGAFGEGSNLSRHFDQKLDGIMGEDRVCRPEHILKLVKEMGLDNQLIFCEWVNKNYDSGFDIIRK